MNNIFDYSKYDVEPLEAKLVEIMYTVDCFRIYNGIEGAYVHCEGVWYDTKEEMEEALEGLKMEYDKLEVRECKIINIIK